MTARPETQSAARVEKVCSHCGSADVLRDAYAYWDVDRQEWVLEAVYDDAFCRACDGETTLIAQPAHAFVDA